MAGSRHVVPPGLQTHQRQLVLTRLGLLQGEHVDVVTVQNASTWSMRERRELTFQVGQSHAFTLDRLSLLPP